LFQRFPTTLHLGNRFWISEPGTSPDHFWTGLEKLVYFVLFPALLFNGLAYALLTSDATFSNLTRLQRMMISNKLLRCMMSLCERAHCPCAAPCP
jgi:hypothetical protein